MLASIINTDGDIEIFLTKKEIEKLATTFLRGEIFEFQNPDKRYSLEVLLEKERECKKSGGKIGNCIQNNKFRVYISDVTPITSYYKTLREEGMIGTRYGNIKIDIIEESLAERYSYFSKDLRFMRAKDSNRSPKMN
jgi:hypothetical protein